MVAPDHPTTVWAYGAVKSVTFQGTSHLGIEYQGNATYGFSAILNQTNTSATSFELSANRTMGALFTIEYCYPSCTAPKYWLHLHFHVLEYDQASANFTTTGLVYENGQAVAALGLVNSTSHSFANWTAGSDSNLPMMGTAVARSSYFGLQVVSNASVAFTPALGLFPENLSTPQSWNSSAAYHADGLVRWAAHSGGMGPEGNVSAGTHGTLPLERSGNVSLEGSYAVGDQVSLGGASFAGIVLRFTGPFTLREGFILVPASADLFGDGGSTWSSNTSSQATSSMGFLDLAAHPLHGAHLGVAASSWVFGSSSLGPSMALLGVSQPALQISGAPQVSGAPDTQPATVVQGQPESPSEAQTVQSCLASGAGCSSNGSNGPGLRTWLGVAILAVAIGVVVVLATALVARRRMPPPMYPNAQLYPPGAAQGARTQGTNPPPPPPGDDDPLKNLW